MNVTAPAPPQLTPTPASPYNDMFTFTFPTKPAICSDFFFRISYQFQTHPNQPQYIPRFRWWSIWGSQAATTWHDAVKNWIAGGGLAVGCRSYFLNKIYMMSMMIDWLIDWLTDWLIDWLIDWLDLIGLIDWLIWLIWLIDWLIDWCIFITISIVLFWWWVMMMMVLYLFPASTDLFLLILYPR